VRWTIEFCFIAALLTGVGLQLGWNQVKDRRTRTALIAYVVVVFVALTMRPRRHGLGISLAVSRSLLLATLLLAYYFHARRRLAFYLLAFVVTVAALVGNIPGARNTASDTCATWPSSR